MSWSLNKIRPPVGRRRPVTTFRIDDFPAPFGPTMTVISPDLASRSTSHRTCVPAYPAEIVSSRSMGRFRPQISFDDPRVPHDLGRAAFRNLAALFDHDDVTGDGQDGPHHMRDDKRSKPDFLLDRREEADRVPEFVGRQAGKDFVQE